MQLSWRHQFQFAGFYAAIKQGYYEKAGLEVVLSEGGPEIDCSEVVLQTAQQYCSASGAVLKRIFNGEKIVILASIIQYSPIVLLTRKDSGLTTPRSLIGKRVESLFAGEPIAEIEAMFQQQGIELLAINSVNNSEGIDALVNGEVDAKFAYVSSEPYLLDSSGFEYNIIYPRDYGIDFYGDVIITSANEISEHGDRARRFKEATVAGWRYALANQTEIVDYIAENYTGADSKPALLAEAHIIEKLMFPKLVTIGYNNMERWEMIAETLASLGDIKPSYSLESVIYQDDQETFLGHSFLSHPFFLWLSAGVVGLCFVVGILWCYNRRLAQEVEVQLKGRKNCQAAREEAITKAYTDDLTGLGNRRSFYEQGASELAIAKQLKDPLTVILLDIDHFKKINDKHGHLVGDEVIRSTANIILGRIRETDVHGRIGGEEFAVLLPNTDLSGAVSLAEEMRVMLEGSEVVVNNEVIKVTASFGISKLAREKDDLHAILKRADDALYRAKEAGRNIVMTNNLRNR